MLMILFFGGANKKYNKAFADLMAKKFAMSMIGELKYSLDFQVKQLDNNTFMFQEKHPKDILKKFDMTKANLSKMPMLANTQLGLREGEQVVDQKVYRSMIGSLLYLCTSRLDIMLSVKMCDLKKSVEMFARYQFTPKESHLVAVKRMLRYLVPTLTIGLWY
jgi:hypothetical protein